MAGLAATLGSYHHRPAIEVAWRWAEATLDGRDAAAAGAGPLDVLAVRLAFVAIAAIAVFAAFASGSRRGSRGRALADAATIVVLAMLSAWPVFGRPFTFDATVLRVAYAAGHPLGDWNHPALSYVLSFPVTLFSIEPWAMRIPQFAYCVAVALALLWAGREAGGRPAGLMAAIWYVGGIRARQGMSDLGDWDLAGLFLVLAVAWMLRFERGDREPSWRSFLFLAAVVALGGLSSHLFVVPGAGVVAVLAARYSRDAPPRWWVLGMAAVVAAFTARTVVLFGEGTHAVPTGPASGLGLATDMLRELHAGQPPWMLVPMGIGIGALVANWRRPSSAAALFAMLVTPAAVAAAWTWSFSHGGYYLDLVAGVACLTAATGMCGVATKARDLAAAHAARVPPVAVRVAIAALAGAAFLVCVDLPDPPAADMGGGNIGAFARVARASGRTVVTTNTGLGAMLKYYRARDEEDPAAAREALDPATPPRERVVVIDTAACATGGQWPDGEPFHLVLSANQPKAVESPCWTFARTACMPIFEPSWDFSFFDCPAVTKRR